MQRYSYGAQGRGGSNSINSPGVSAIFGGDTTSYTAAPVRPATTSTIIPAGMEKPMTRYTNTYKSNAFSHATYQPPLVNDKSAATVVLEKTGTAIEDFGRRNPRKLVEQEIKPTKSNGKPATLAADLKVMHEESFKNKLDDKYKEISHVRDNYTKYETLANKKSTPFQMEREKFKQDAQQQIKEFYDKKQQAWNEKAHNYENKQQTLKLNEEIKASKQEQVKEESDRKMFLGELIRKQIDKKNNSVVHDKQDALSHEQKSNGLRFECYTRDEIMRQQHLQNGGQLKGQLVENEQKRHEQLMEDKRPPPNLVRTEDLIEMKQRQKQEDKEVKQRNKVEMEMSQHYRLQNKLNEENSQFIAKQIERELAEKANQKAFEREYQNQLNKMDYSSFAK